MKIYHYEAETGKYLGSSDARKSPFEEGAYLVPANATKTAPPQTTLNEVAVFGTDGTWSVKPDFSNVQLWSRHDGQPVKVKSGVSLEEAGATAEPRPSAAHVWGAQGWTLDADKQGELEEKQKQAKLKDFVSSIQDNLDNFARTGSYDGILSACTYATSTVEKFRLEGQRCVALRDATWEAAYTILAEVEAGARPMPTETSDIKSSLPTLSWS